MSLIEVKNIYKSFNGVKILEDINLNIEEGDFISIIGASGSGKSTLLTILGGIDKPDSGSVFIEGTDITKIKEGESAILRRTKLGFVFQFFNLAPYLNVYENISLPLVLNSVKIKNYTEKIDKLIEYLGIAAFKEKMPSKLSGGEQQRVAIARGLIFEPKIILLDEPTGNLDSKNSLEIMKLLKKINEDTKTTIVQVTHSDKNAAYGNKIISIMDGKIVSL